MKNIKSLKIEPNIIAKKDIDYIENMESEKYRKAKIRNGNNRCK